MNGLDAQFDEYKKLLESEFLGNVDAGMKNHAARRKAKESVNRAYPDIAEMMRAAMRTSGDNPETAAARKKVSSMTGFWNNLNKIANERRGGPPVLLPIPAAPPPTMPPTNGYKPTNDIKKYLTAIDPAIGEEIPLNLEFLRYKYDKANDSAYRYPFISKDSRLILAGWKFEVINNTTREYRIRIIDKPAPPKSDEEIARENQLAAMKAQFSAMEAQLTAIAAAIADMEK